MAATSVLPQLEEFAEFVKVNEPLAPFTGFKVGGPAEVLVQPRSVAELLAVLGRCLSQRLPFRILGAGNDLLVHDEGVSGVVLRLQAAPFTEVSVHGRRVRAGAGASISALISAASHHGLAGLESLVGSPGTVGGALCHEAGGQGSDIWQFVRQVEVIDAAGQLQTRDRDEMRLAYRDGNFDDPLLLAAEFELEPDSADAIVKRMRKAWIQRKASRPHSFQAACCVFKNPRGLTAATLIEKAGLVGRRVGGAEINDRDPTFIVADPGTSARDILRLIDLVRSQVQERFQVQLELAISIW